MAQHCFDDAKFCSTSASTSSCPLSSQSPSHPSLRCSHKNVFWLLARREISPRARYSSKRLRKGTTKYMSDCIGPKWLRDTRSAINSWVEAESLHHLSAKYCPLLPPPRSTIAAAFSLDGTTLASTHGDHTVKIIDCQTWRCLKVLRGHRRTPWVVRFHPLYSEILASGSLDHEVRLWDACSAICIGSHDFYRPIASIAFHAQGELLAVASGHKLFIWNYNSKGEASSPSIVLRTRRSLRAVHFHPYAAPLLLTAEVAVDSPDSPLTLAASSGYSPYPPPAIFFARLDTSLRAHLEANPSLMPSPYYFWPTFIRDEGRSPSPTGGGDSGSANNLMQAESALQIPSPAFQAHGMDIQIPASQSRSRVEGTIVSSSNPSALTDLQAVLRNVEGGQLHQFIPVNDPARWELPFLDGWLMGQTHAGLNAAALPADSDLQGNPSIGLGRGGADLLTSDLLYSTRSMEALLSSNITAAVGQSRASGRSDSRRSRSRTTPSTRSGEGATLSNPQSDELERRAGRNDIRSEIPASLAAAVEAAELPCTVKLRIWAHDIRVPCAPLNPDTCRLTIPHAVLCSEMGAHFSPCGRFLVACVACMLPQTESDPGLQAHHIHRDATGNGGASPTRHPISAHQVIYELRVYSLEEATFGAILASRAIRAAHCLTSIQFSPTSEHIILAYGRRHSSLLRSIVIDKEIAIPIYTILEVYRVSDMELVRVVPSADDEVNVACFHPLVGGGIVYGTKEGKLRILQFDGSQDTD